MPTLPRAAPQQAAKAVDGGGRSAPEVGVLGRFTSWELVSLPRVLRQCSGSEVALHLSTPDKFKQLAYQFTRKSR